MRRTLLLIVGLAITGCGPEFARRTDSDLARVTPKELRNLKSIRLDPGYSPELSKQSTWLVHSSLSDFHAVTDGDPSTVASSRRATRKGDWILIDLGSECYFQHVVQSHPGAGQPNAYRVDTAGGKGFPYTLQFVGTGSPIRSHATLPRAVRARFVRITLTEEPQDRWQVAEIEFE